MAKKDILKRGFKANAERLAKKYREKLSIHPCGPLPALKLAEYLKIYVYKATDILTSEDDINLLLGKNGEECGWSALTMVTKANSKIIIYNPFHSDLRQQSDIMHEISHVICKHEHQEKVYDFEIPFGMRHFDEVQEEEAKCLASTFQLATPCLLWAAKKKMTFEEISKYFTASIDMIQYRMNMTGIMKRY